MSWPQGYARGAAAIVPQPKATNISGSGYEVRRAAGAAFCRLGGLPGFSQGALGGGIAAEMTFRSIGIGGGWLRAKAATAGVLPNRSVVPGVAGGLLLGDIAKTAAGDYLGVR